MCIYSHIKCLHAKATLHIFMFTLRYQLHSEKTEKGKQKTIQSTKILYSNESFYSSSSAEFHQKYIVHPAYQILVKTRARKNMQAEQNHSSQKHYCLMLIGNSKSKVGRNSKNVLHKYRKSEKVSSDSTAGCKAYIKCDHSFIVITYFFSKTGLNRSKMCAITYDHYVKKYI